jgi:sec-independent protein translocase protein TatA
MPIHPFWIIAIVVVVLIIFGPGRLPELGGAIGKAMREFRKATSELTNEVTQSTQPTQPTQAASPPQPVAAPPAAPAPSESTTAQGGSESASPSSR